MWGPLSLSRGMENAELVREAFEHGHIKVSCEFCSKSYEFEPAEFKPVN